MKDGAATRRRMLDAATAEFVAHGIAGSRIDRISAASRGSKAQLYAYFGSKDGLFDAVFTGLSRSIVATVPLTAEDLPGYAVAVHDDCLRHPELVRLATWARLERYPTGGLGPDLTEQAAERVDAIAAAQRDGYVEPALHPADVLAMVNAMALTWSSASLFHAATEDEPTVDHDRRRAALRLAVERAFCRSPGSDA